MGPEAELVVEENRDEGAHAELHEVGEGWLEVVAISKLESVPPLNSSVKDKASFGSVRLRVVLLPDVLSLQGGPEKPAPLLQQGIGPGSSSSNRHL